MIRLGMRWRWKAGTAQNILQQRQRVGSLKRHRDIASVRNLSTCSSIQPSKNRFGKEQLPKTRWASTTAGNGGSHDDDEKTNYARLLTRATAMQLRGDIPRAIVLTSRALLVLRERQLSGRDEYDETSSRVHHQTKEDLDLADALVFLGKLLRLQYQWEDAARSFTEARWILHGLQYASENENATVLLRTKECTAVSFLASCHAHLGDTDLARSSFEEALEGLVATVGWEDGMTNHTASEWVRLLRGEGFLEEAFEVVTRTKEGLSDVFGPRDIRVLQWNGELADIVASQQRPSQQHKNNSSNHHHHHRAMELLETALDALPPNSPEARRLFVQLEDLKERVEGNDDDDDDDDHLGDVSVTVTKNSGSNSTIK